MVRKSFQKGCLQWHGGQWTLLYRVKENGRMIQKRESVAFAEFVDRKNKKAAREFGDICE